MPTDKANTDAAQISGIPNLTYDLNALLHNKLEGIAALEGYKADCQGDQEASSLFEEMQKRNAEDVQRIKPMLMKHLGK
jgi:hypothetical protein